MKYINFLNIGIILFPVIQNHKDIAMKIKDQAVSAGFVQRNHETNKYECYGHSISLGIGSHPDDTSLLWEQGLLY